MLKVYNRSTGEEMAVNIEDIMRVEKKTYNQAEATHYQRTYVLLCNPCYGKWMDVSEEYNKVTRPSFKDADCFAEMLGFAGRVKEYVPNVMLTVVDIIGEEEIKRSQAIADSVGIKLRVRKYES